MSLTDAILTTLWLHFCYILTAFLLHSDRADDSAEDAEDVPIVPLEESVQASLALPQVTSVLDNVSLTEPGPGEQ